MDGERIIRILKEERIDPVASLPCDRMKDLCLALPEHFRHLTLTREEDGVGICAGAYLGGGRPAMVIQSSGLGNSLNAIASLTQTYGLPLPILASWRGIYREAVPAQVPFNRALPAVLDALAIPYTVIETAEDIPNIRDVIDSAFREGSPHVALMLPCCFEGEAIGGPCRRPLPEGAPQEECRRRAVTAAMTRFQAIEAVAEVLDGEAVVSNIGVPSRELYAIRDRDLNFYMLGSYTQASPIALGLALQTDRDVIVLDGDGSLLGTAVLPVIAAASPTNLVVVGLDNGTFGSTGDQPTPSRRFADLELLAIAAGIPRTCRAATGDELQACLEERGTGPRFVHVPICPGNAEVGHIPLSPVQIRDRFMTALGSRQRPM